MNQTLSVLAPKLVILHWAAMHVADNTVEETRAMSVTAHAGTSNQQLAFLHGSILVFFFIVLLLAKMNGNFFMDKTDLVLFTGMNLTTSI